MNGIQYKVYPLLALNGASSYIAPIYMPSQIPPSSARRGSSDNSDNFAEDEQQHNDAVMARISKSNNLKVYPNPAQKVLNVVYEIQEGIQNASISIYGLDGKMISQGVLTDSAGEKQLDISSMRNGQYICTIEGNGAKLKQLKFAITR